MAGWLADLADALDGSEPQSPGVWTDSCRVCSGSLGATVRVRQDRLGLPLRIIAARGDLLGQKVRAFGDPVLVYWLGRNAYTERILRAAEHDPVVAAAFSDVSDLVASPQDILRPRFLWRVLRGNLRRTPPTPDPVHPTTHQPLVLELSRRAVTRRDAPSPDLPRSLN